MTLTQILEDFSPESMLGTDLYGELKALANHKKVEITDSCIKKVGILTILNTIPKEKMVFKGNVEWLFGDNHNLDRILIIDGSVRFFSRRNYQYHEIDLIKTGNTYEGVEEWDGRWGWWTTEKNREIKFSIEKGSVLMF